MKCSRALANRAFAVVIALALWLPGPAAAAEVMVQSQVGEMGVPGNIAGAAFGAMSGPAAIGNLSLGPVSLTGTIKPLQTPIVAVRAPSVNEGGQPVPVELLRAYQMDLNAQGKVVYAGTDETVPASLVKQVVSAAHKILPAEKTDAVEAGKQLLAWGLPVAYNGKHLVNPDGSAGYLGLKIYEALSRNPDAVKSLSQERLMETMDLMSQAFMLSKEAPFEPEVAVSKMDAAWGLLSRTQLSAGEQKLELTPMDEIGNDLPGFLQKNFQAIMTAGNKRLSLLKSSKQDPKQDPELKEIISASVALQKLSQQTYADLGPSLAVATHGELPTLLKVLDRLNGQPLTDMQAKALIQSFPLGELIYKSGAFKLWRKGITGEGAKVAFIDTSIPQHPDTEPAMDKRFDATDSRGPLASQDHALSGASIVHALAPGARISSYQAISNRGVPLADGGIAAMKTAFRKAVATAVRDGNQLINMSMGFSMQQGSQMYYLLEFPDLVRFMTRLHEKFGVIFTVAAGNAREIGEPVNWLAWAEGAVPFTASNAAGTIADFGNTRAGYDRTSGQIVTQKVLVTPGVNDPIAGVMKMDEQTLPVIDKDSKKVVGQARMPTRYVPIYKAANGTSFSAPYGNGLLALLWSSARRIVSSLGMPVDVGALSQKAVEALFATGVPQYVPGAQGEEFFTPDLLAASDHLEKGLAGAPKNSGGSEDANKAPVAGK